MSTEKTVGQMPTCPSCGGPLDTKGDLLRCAEHGEFFRYSPRLLVRVASQNVAAPLMPWQTLRERTA